MDPAQQQPNNLTEHMLASQTLQFTRKTKIKTLWKLFLIVTVTEISIILFMLSSILKLDNLKIVGFCVLAGLFMGIGMYSVRYYRRKQREGNFQQEDREAHTTIIGLLYFVAVFMEMCAFTQLFKSYVYVLYGSNIFIIVSGLALLIFKHRTARFFLRYIFILFSFFWIMYYFLNVTWGRSIHWALTVYFGLVAALCLFFAGMVVYELKVSQVSMGIVYYYSIYMYFYVNSFIIQLGYEPPFLYLTAIIHPIFIMFIIGCISTLCKLKPKNQSPLFEMYSISNNVLRKKQQNQNMINQTIANINEQQNLPHQCRVCLLKESIYALECQNGFYHLCICDQCVSDWFTKFKGKCQICNQQRNVILKIKRRVGDGGIQVVNIFQIEA